MAKKDMELKELSEEFEMFEGHGFADVFHSEYDQTKQFNGMEFEVLGRVPLEECWMCGSPLWRIKCNNVVFDAYPVEVIEGLW